MVSRLYALSHSYLDFLGYLRFFPFPCPNCALGALSHGLISLISDTPLFTGKTVIIVKGTCLYVSKIYLTNDIMITKNKKNYADVKRLLTGSSISILT